MTQHKNLLLLSSSRVGDTDYLAHNREWIKNAVGDATLLFIPYAGVGMTHSQYTDKIRNALAPVNVAVTGIEEYADPIAPCEAQAIAVIWQHQLLNLIYQQLLSRPRYSKWGTPMLLGCINIAETIKTTNDMPIVEPPSFNALRLASYK